MVQHSRQAKLEFAVVGRRSDPFNADKAPTLAIAERARDSAIPSSASTAFSTPSSTQSSQASARLFHSLKLAMEELPDSTDWISTSLPLFEPLEASLRCEVCKEFYENPVITACSHTFCSLCIRRCISDDGKCPACKSPCQANRLVPNFVVREIVSRFQAARPTALELARRQKEDATETPACKKRKLEQTDIEEIEPARRTRSRTTRSGNGKVDTPVEILDSEDEGDAEFIPEGMVACPICSTTMKEEQVWLHLSNGTCSGEKKSAAGRGTRSRANNRYSSSIIGRVKDPPPPPSRLPGLTYALLKDTALRKKLEELGIPAWGKKELLIRRHTEWLHLWNSNCDAADDQRKSKRELLKELDTWERTRGGHAHAVDSTVMKKSFDGKSHADAHRGQFDELIAAARKAKAMPKEENKGEDMARKEDNEETQRNEPKEQQDDSTSNPEPQQTVDPARPYEGNEAALATIRDKVEETNRNGSILPPRGQLDPSQPPESSSVPPDSSQTGMSNPLGSPSKKLPMFLLPEDPVMDVENSTAVP